MSAEQKNNFMSKLKRILGDRISDGILRVLAFIAISEIEPANAIFLLDEVENGINSDYAEAMIDVLSEIYEESRHQLVLTTHSTVFLDYVKPEQIVLLYRDQNGSTRADNLFDSKEIRDKLEYMYPGEILLNMSQKEIIRRNILCAAHP